MFASSNMQNKSQIASYSARGIPRITGEDKMARSSQNARMGRPSTKASANHLRAWREFRFMTQEDLADAVGTAGNVIGLLESGERGLSQKWLNKLAPALGTTPGYLLDHDPKDIPTDLLETWAAIPSEDRPRALAVLGAFKKTGTAG